VIPVGEGHREAAAVLHARLAAEGYRVEVDERDDTLGKRIRDAELQKVPFVVVYGDRESDAARSWREFAQLAVRERGGEQSTVSLDDLLARFGELASEADPR
jgi:threonyl-tRNA synthetase